MKDPQDSQRQQLARSQGKAQQGAPQPPPEPPIQQQQYPNEEQYGLGLDQPGIRHHTPQQKNGNGCIYLLIMGFGLFVFAIPFGGCSLGGQFGIIPTFSSSPRPSAKSREAEIATRAAAAEEFGGLKEANKTHYWNGSVFVEGKAPSLRAHRAAKKLGLGSEQEAKKTHDWNYVEWVPKDK